MRDDECEVKTLPDEDELEDLDEYNYEDDYVSTPVDLMSCNFHGYNEGRNSNANLGDSGWGVGMPPGKYTWVNPSDPELIREIQMAYIVYGNDLGSMVVRYSRAAMLIRIPPYEERDERISIYASIFAGIKEDKVEYPDYSAKDDSIEEGMGRLF